MVLVFQPFLLSLLKLASSKSGFLSFGKSEHQVDNVEKTLRNWCMLGIYPSIVAYGVTCLLNWVT
jgi:hypothetical protein